MNQWKDKEEFVDFFQLCQDGDCDLSLLFANSEQTRYTI